MDSLTSLRSTSVPAKAAVVEKPTSESRVDSDSHFDGLYKTQQNLRIEGIAEGEIQCEGTLTVAEGARVKATVTASTITIAGELEGEVMCRGVFQIMPTGRVDAIVSAHRLIVQEGGLYNGEFHMITDDKKTEKPGAASSAPINTGKATASAAEPPADVKPTSDVVGSTEWWEKMTNPNPPATGSDDNPI
jgi:cytoskeletal protein CcmA (bactofilin family)